MLLRVRGALADTRSLGRRTPTMVPDLRDTALRCHSGSQSPETWYRGIVGAPAGHARGCPCREDARCRIVDACGWHCCRSGGVLVTDGAINKRINKNDISPMTQVYSLYR